MAVCAGAVTAAEEGESRSGAFQSPNPLEAMAADDQRPAGFDARFTQQCHRPDQVSPQRPRSLVRLSAYSAIVASIWLRPASSTSRAL